MAYHAFVDHSLVDNQQYVQDAIFHEALNQDYHDNNHDTDITELTYEQKIERDHPLNDKQFDANNPHTIESFFDSLDVDELEAGDDNETERQNFLAESLLPAMQGAAMFSQSRIPSLAPPPILPPFAGMDDYLSNLKDPNQTTLGQNSGATAFTELNLPHKVV